MKGQKWAVTKREEYEMKLTLHTFLSIDGVIQAPGGPDEDTSGGFEHGGWVAPFVDEGFGEIVDSWFRRADAFLLGRTTYGMFYPFWSQVTDPEELVAEKLNGLPKYVASRTLKDPEWQHTTVLEGDALDQVRALKEQPGGELQVHGSCGLAGQLHEAGLIDEYRLMVFPVLIGQGKRLFTEGMPSTGFTVTHSRITEAGVTYTELTPGPLSTGAEFVVEDGKLSLG